MKTNQVTSKSKVSLHHFKVGPVIGRGAFSQVNWVMKKDTKETFALKSIPKEQCFRQKICRNILRERTILELVHHPFMVNMKYAFHEHHYMCLVLDLMLGHDLRFHLQKLGQFTEPMVVFFAAEMCSALTYLHRNHIAHRDIKPENILLDQVGHLHVTDFNCAIILSPGKKLNKVIGTHGYIAPEIYNAQGYNERVDWWSLGVMLWEFLHGKLLERNPDYRLGASPSSRYDVMSHLIFNSLHWDLLESKRLIPPYLPATLLTDDPSFSKTSMTSSLRTVALPSATTFSLPRCTSLKTHEKKMLERGFKYFDHRQRSWPRKSWRSPKETTATTLPTKKNSKRRLWKGMMPYPLKRWWKSLRIFLTLSKP
ncbi:hypothetical protein HMI54_002505 [Coelomomyces lativittatus]|nr:hypothetical protein HMI54_002505 [Coelomomyces lativittatus]